MDYETIKVLNEELKHIPAMSDDELRMTYVSALHLNQHPTHPDSKDFSHHILQAVSKIMKDKGVSTDGIGMVVIQVPTDAIFAQSNSTTSSELAESMIGKPVLGKPSLVTTLPEGELKVSDLLHMNDLREVTDGDLGRNASK